MIKYFLIKKKKGDRRQIISPSSLEARVKRISHSAHIPHPTHSDSQLSLHSDFHLSSS